MNAIIRISILVCLAFAANPVLAATQCPAGTVGYWPMEGDGTEVINNIAGSLVGDVSFSPGQSGQAADFNGDIGSYIDVGQSSLLTGFGLNSMSVSAWVYRKADGDAGDDFSPVITARTFCNTGNWQLYASLAWIDPGFYFSKWGQSVVEQEDMTFSSSAIPLMDWTHVAATYDGNEVRFYVNGNLDKTVTPLQFGGDINNSLQNIQIGWDSCSSFFNGSLDEVAVFDVALSGAEVSDMYIAGFNGKSFCSSDEDEDGFDDDLDICPTTTGSALLDGCDCYQILDFKPGKGGKCNIGTLKVFAKRIGWAKDVPLP